MRTGRAQYKTILAALHDPAHPDVVAVAARLAELTRQRKAVPRRVTVGELERPTVRLPARTKNLYDGLKTLAWQIETDLFHDILARLLDDTATRFPGTNLRMRFRVEGVTDDEPAAAQSAT